MHGFKGLETMVQSDGQTVHCMQLSVELVQSPGFPACEWMRKLVRIEAPVWK